MFPSGLASREGTIQKGNEVLSINGKSLKGATHNDALAILRQARDPRQAVVVTRKPTLEAAPDLPATDSAASTSAAGDVSAESGKFSQRGGAVGQAAFDRGPAGAAPSLVAPGTHTACHAHCPGARLCSDVHALGRLCPLACGRGACP